MIRSKSDPLPFLISDFMSLDKKWDVHALANYFNAEMMTAIMQIPIPLQSCPDHFCWSHSNAPPVNLSGILSILDSHEMRLLLHLMNLTISMVMETYCHNERKMLSM